MSWPRDTLCNKFFTLLAEFVPELVELRVVGPARVVRELVEHGVEHLLVGDEVEVAAVAPEPQLHLDAPVDVEPQQPRVLRRELGEDLDAPLAAAHDGLDLLGDAVEERARGGLLGLPLERPDLPHLVQVAHLHRRRRSGGRAI